MTERRKMIEVSLPLEAINVASAREKSIRHGHPSTLHLWWARRPLATCRAVIFASLVDDPGEKDAPLALLARIDTLPIPLADRPLWDGLSLVEQRRKKLEGFLARLVEWESTNNKEILQIARELILAATDGNPPPLLDPFCGGGSIPLEAQRLGLEAHASDLNPVAVLITKAMIEIPPKFAGQPPVNPTSRVESLAPKWKGAAGLAEDVRYYGQWMRDEAEKRIGHLYPKVTLPKEQGGGEATVIAWLWARTVKCPNPACGAQMPLVRSFWLSTKKGKEAWVEPEIQGNGEKTVHFHVRTGKGGPPESPKVGRGAKFKCLVCGQVADDQHIKDEGMAGRMGAQLMAIVAEGLRGRVYLEPTEEHSIVAHSTIPVSLNGLEQMLAYDPRNIWCCPYGLKTFSDLFTSRQLVVLTTFSDLVGEACERILRDALSSGLPDDSLGLDAGGTGARACADAIATYLAFIVDQLSNHNSSICGWNSVNTQMRTVFARQAIPMVWDFAESNPFCESSGSFKNLFERLCKAFISIPASAPTTVIQLDASAVGEKRQMILFSTDPPYYDNIGYADLSDFFYVWLRRSLKDVYPSLFSTLLVPKAQELVATPYRFEGNKEKAQAFFEEGLGKVFVQMRASQHPAYPMTVYYAFKQAENEEENQDGHNGVASTGWETMLQGLVKAGFQITATWPMHTEKIGRSLEIGTNALASSIVIVCRPRLADAPLATRREFLAALKTELPPALMTLQKCNIAPVDLAQAVIGPGMAVFSRTSKVLEADGSAMGVRTALQLINQELDTYLIREEGDLDADTRFAMSWFEQRGMEEGPYGEAEVLSKAKNTSMNGMVEAGILQSRAGKVRLLRREELAADWDPATDRRLTVWECTQHLIATLETGGEEAAARIVKRLGGGKSEEARSLAYRLYAICERKSWAAEALSYNALVTSWPELLKLTLAATASQDHLGF